MKKGFTLIELLAVIVILAIIALIATPIILNIINDSKLIANEISAQNYLDAVELAIAKQNLNGEFSPNTCVIEEDGKLLCDGDKTLNVGVEGESPSSGYISLKNGKVESYSLIIDEETIENSEINPLVVDAYYPVYGQSVSNPINPTINSNNLTVSNIGPGHQFRIDLPKEGYSFDWVVAPMLSIKFYPYSNPTIPENIFSYVPPFVLEGTYETKEAGYIIFDINGCTFSINNLKYNNIPVTINYNHPTANIRKVSTGCTQQGSSFTCESNVEDGGTVNEPIYVFVDHHPNNKASIQINDGQWTNMNQYYSNNSYFQITEPGTYKIRVAYRPPNSTSTFWPSEEYFNVTITE